MRIVLGLLLSLMLSFTLVLMPNYPLSLEFKDKEVSNSCCKSEEFTENHCQNSSNENKKCDGECFKYCCCFKLLLNSEKQTRIEVEFFQGKVNSIDMYSNSYKYSFHSCIDKPPTHFIS